MPGADAGDEGMDRVVTRKNSRRNGIETRRSRERQTSRKTRRHWKHESGRDRELKELIEFLKENGIGEFDLERGDLKVRLKFARRAATQIWRRLSRMLAAAAQLPVGALPAGCLWCRRSGWLRHSGCARGCCRETTMLGCTL